MLILVDIGNTNITTAFYDGSIKHVFRFDTEERYRNGGKYISRLKHIIYRYRLPLPEGAAVCSVVPDATPLVTGALNAGFGLRPLLVDHRLKTGLKFRIKNPAGLGADRIANTVAARNLYKGQLIVIDFGTATTFDAISTQGVYRGGVIMPGPGISAWALSEKTAGLPVVTPEAPVRATGTDTESNILSGLILGHAGAVERIIKEIKSELFERKGAGNRAVTNVVATGGYAGLITPYIKGIKAINPLLTLRGLRIIYELNT